MAPHARRRHVVIGGQIFGALAGGDDAKAGGARPVHHLGGQRRLVAIGQRIDHAGLARFFREQRPRQHVGLDIDHDDVLAGGNRGAGVADADRGIAGGFHDHFDVAAGCRRAIVGEFRRRDPRVHPSRRCGRPRARAPDRDRRSPALRAPAYAAPATRTSSRTCRRRSSATRTGLPAAWRLASRWWRFMGD